MTFIVRRIVRLASVVASAATIAAAGACGGDGNGSNADGPFELVVHPEFIQGVYGGVPVPVLVSVEDAETGDGDVALEATFSGGRVEVDPLTIADGEIAEVTITGDAVTDDVEGELTITAKRGSVERVASHVVLVVPGEDDRGPTASDLLRLFAVYLEDSHPDLGIGPDTTFEGSFVAPRLLVVSHYMFEDERYELGISWHVTIQPHDWSELYLRPRDELRPTRAFRMSSWSAALAGEPVEFSEVPPPAEVVR